MDGWLAGEMEGWMDGWMGLQSDAAGVVGRRI